MFWRLWFYLKRHLVIMVTVCFMGIGATLLGSSLFAAPPFDTLLVNFGTEFVGGVLLLVVYAAVQSRVSVLRGIDYRDFQLRIKRTRRKFRVLTTFSYLFTDGDEIPDSLKKNRIAAARNKFEELVVSPKSVSIQILVLNPDSEGARQRARDRSNENVVERIKSNLSYLYNLKKLDSSNVLEVRVYDSLPRLSLFQWDDTLSVSFFERDKTISESIRTEVRVDQPFGEFVSSAFDQLWDDAATCSIEEYMSVA